MDFSRSLLQLRELVKDIWWRNKAEQACAQLDILQRQLELRKRYGEFDLGTVLPAGGNQDALPDRDRFEPAPAKARSRKRLVRRRG